MLYRGPYRPPTRADGIIAELVSESIARGNENMGRGLFREAIFDFDTAICLMPNLPQAHHNKAHALLALGEYQDGFREFEWRLPLIGDPLGLSGVALWRGEDLVGKRLLVYHEYGYGDSLMLLRYIPVLKALGAVVTLLLPPELVRIARALDVDIRDHYPETANLFDYRCPFFSVVTNLQHGVKDIPPAGGIGLSRGANDVLPSAVGIAWSGNRSHGRDTHRSIELEDFLGLLANDGRDLHSVQNSECDLASSCGVIARSFQDFVDTASLMLRLQHIVTVDTAAAHLAGIIDHPSVHIMVPYSSDWRWYSAEVWYPKINVHRQDRPGDWSSAFAKVNKFI